MALEGSQSSLTVNFKSKRNIERQSSFAFALLNSGVSMRRYHSMPFGAEVTSDGIRFALWAPSAEHVHLVLDDAELPMTPKKDGWYQLRSNAARVGTRYGFKIDREVIVPDPASRFQPDDVHGRSQVVAPQAYKWSQADWKGRPWEETVIYELHVGTVTQEGTYSALMGKLEFLRDLGITAVELMPVAEFPGQRNWGYDGVLPYAPDAAYGTPDDLKRLVDRAHELGLMVFLDVVYNHFGPSGNYLHVYAREFFTDKHHTPWGAGINVDGKGGRHVRDFFIHNALYWLEEYQFDGLRFDAVHAIVDDSEPHFLEELATRTREAFPGRHIHLILENEANQARWLARKENGKPRLHTAQWADDSHNAWHVLLTGESEGYYQDYASAPLQHLGRALAEGFSYQGDLSPHKKGTIRGEFSAHLPPSAFISFLQNHDQIGNRAFGERLSHLVEAERLELAEAIFLLTPQIPMIFMGEEWGASSPFQFFVGFESEPNLAKAVRDGRRGEFKHFSVFTDPKMAERIPDPTDRATFERSKIDWGEADREPHRGILARTRSLLELRRNEIVPLLKSSYSGSFYTVTSNGALDITWRFSKGRLRLLANFGSETIGKDFNSDTHILWSSQFASPADASIQLRPWTGILLKDNL